MKTLPYHTIFPPEAEKYRERPISFLDKKAAELLSDWAKKDYSLFSTITAKIDVPDLTPGGVTSPLVFPMDGCQESIIPLRRIKYFLDSQRGTYLELSKFEEE